MATLVAATRLEGEVNDEVRLLLIDVFVGVAVGVVVHHINFEYPNTKELKDLRDDGGNRRHIAPGARMWSRGDEAALVELGDTHSPSSCCMSQKALP